MREVLKWLSLIAATGSVVMLLISLPSATHMLILAVYLYVISED